MTVAAMAAVNVIALSNVSLCDCRNQGVDLNVDFPFTVFSGHTLGSALVNFSGRLSLSSAQFALL